MITVGMLERINGAEKGDAIVSVRGYEPIWSRFTPSYELKEIYFQAGEAGLRKREPRLFEKNKYVFDIQGDKIEKENERILEEIENEGIEVERAEQAKAEHIAELDRQWAELKEKVKENEEKLLPLLDIRDATELQKAALENKVPILYMIADKYDKSIGQKLLAIAKMIESQVKEMQKIQAQAKEL